MRTPGGLAAVRRYAAGVGPWIGQILTTPGPGEQPGFTDLVARARASGLLVHPYTLRRDALPKGIDTFDTLLHAFLLTLRVDGIFTDFPDLAVRFRDRQADCGAWA